MASLLRDVRDRAMSRLVFFMELFSGFLGSCKNRWALEFNARFTLGLTLVDFCLRMMIVLSWPISAMLMFVFFVVFRVFGLRTVSWLLSGVLSEVKITGFFFFESLLLLPFILIVVFSCLVAVLY